MWHISVRADPPWKLGSCVLNCSWSWGSTHQFCIIGRAHRVPQRNDTSSNGCWRPNPILCKFMRRMARDKALAAIGNANALTADDLDLSSSTNVDQIAIYSHLTPKLRSCWVPETLGYNFKWSWVTGTTDSSETIRLRSTSHLENLLLHESSPPSPPSQNCPGWTVIQIILLTWNMKLLGKATDKSKKSLLKKLPYFNCRGDLSSINGQFNNFFVSP